MRIGEAIRSEAAWGKTWNGADTLTTTLNKCLDMFGRAGAMRHADRLDKMQLFADAYEENPDMAMKLLFYTRDVRGGYGERQTFLDMVTWLANKHTESVEKNLWAFIEYGRAKDLYALVGTPAENAMWDFIKAQFELDLRNMRAGKGISLLAKWIATPDASSVETAALGKKTAYKLGYTFKTMRDYKRKLRSMRAYLDIPEAKMSTGRWSEIEYANVPSQCLLRNKDAFMSHDGERYSDFINSVNKGEAKINTGALTPCDIMMKVRKDYSSDLETMWANLQDYCDANALVMCDTSGSMSGWSWEREKIQPIDVAISLSMYFAERNKGDLKNLFMTFESNPHLLEIKGDTLKQKFENIYKAPWGGSTDLEGAFEELLDICQTHNVKPDEMPDALVVISDMQINSCTWDTVGVDNKLTFYEQMSKMYEEAGYRLPQVIFWNVNAVNPSFHASATQGGVSLVSGYSPAVFKAVMQNIGKTPLDLMLSIVNSERYANIVA